jgi:hypothetical protein
MSIAALNAITKVQTPYQGAYFASGRDNPYAINNGKGGTEDFRWIF